MVHFLLLCVFLCLDRESVPESSDCYQVFRCGWIVFDLLTQSVDIYHDGILINNCLAPYYRVDHILGENVVYVVYEKLYHRVFFR